MMIMNKIHIAIFFIQIFWLKEAAHAQETNLEPECEKE